MNGAEIGLPLPQEIVPLIKLGTRAAAVEYSGVTARGLELLIVNSASNVPAELSN